MGLKGGIWFRMFLAIQIVESASAGKFFPGLSLLSLFMGDFAVFLDDGEEVEGIKRRFPLRQV